MEDLRTLRITAGQTQSRVAERVGVSPETVSGWERGNSYPSNSSRLQLASVLGITPAQLATALPAQEHQPGPAPQLSNALIDLREQAGLSRREAAELLGVGAVTIRNWESGHKRPAWPKVAQLAAVYDQELLTVNDALPQPHEDTPLARLRKLAGLSAQQVADTVQVSGHTVRTWERGEQRPPVTLRFRYAAALSVPRRELEDAMADVEPPWDLATLRWRAGLTQQQVAELLGTHRQLVSTWELGTHQPRRDTLVALADLYEVELRCVSDALAGQGRPAAELETEVVGDPTWWMPAVV